MADYYPLISRAVGGLDRNTGENRRVLYERARGALVKQLRSVDPPLEEADITRERQALEEAIRKVEAEAADLAVAEPTAAARETERPEWVTPEFAEPPESAALAMAERAKPVKEPEQAEPGPPAPPEPKPSLRDRGLSDFRHSMAEVEDLGEAASFANRSARKTYADISGERGMPPATHYFEPPAEAPPPHEFALTDHESPFNEYGGAERLPPIEPFEEEEPAPPRVRAFGRLTKITALVLVLIGLGGVGFWQRHAVTTMVAGLHKSEPAAVKPAPAAVKSVSTPKIADRVPPSSSKPANAPAADVAQKVVLYEEDPGNPQGKRYIGSAVWHAVTVSPGPGLAPELAVRADVDVPERQMHMTWSLRRNTDKALPASHTIEIMFKLPPNFDQGGVGNVPGVLMKNSEEARGVPLAGLSVKVTNGYFLIGLSAVDIDKQRNIELLKSRDWFDIPIVYTSGKRAILAMEKGPSGQRVFQEAFRAWGE